MGDFEGGVWAGGSASTPGANSMNPSMKVKYAFGIVKVSRRFVLVVVAATLGIGLMYLAAWILSIFGVSLLLWTDPSPTGIAISVVICVVAALNLFIDFAVID